MRTPYGWCRYPVWALAALAVSAALFSGCQPSTPAADETPAPTRAAAEGLTKPGASAPATGDK